MQSRLLRSSLLAQRVPRIALGRRCHASVATKPGATSGTDSFLSTTSSPYLQDMYAAWRKDPNSVHVSWRAYFSALQNHPDIPARSIYQPPPTAAFGHAPAVVGHQAASTFPPSYANGNAAAAIIGHDLAERAAAGGVALPALVSDVDTQTVHDHLRVQLLVRAYQVRGHNLAQLDPLGISGVESREKYMKDLSIENYGFTQADLDRSFTLGPGMLKGFITKSPQMTLREIVQHLQDIYCGSVGVEYTHIPDREQCDWIRERLEKPNRINFSLEEKRMILDRLVWSDSFEHFVRKKFPSEKRFGLEGCESLICGMKALIDRSVDLGVRSVNLGMPHRGRLNVLSNVVRKSHESIFCEFTGLNEPNNVEGSGDVKYHLGMNYDRPTPSGKRVHLSLVANPSHLEAVDPVVLGKTRATQFYQHDEERNSSMALLIHGDAAFAAQGVVYETMEMANLPAYTTGGTIHLVVNNQIGFTTDPRFARSTPYCTDIARAINAPVFHVNGDDPEAVTWVCELAAEWRQQFKRDVVVDIVCYRKFGHNEIDQPAFTQPLMYQAIKKQEPVLDKYIKQLLNEGQISESEIEKNKKWVWGILEANYEKSKTYEPKQAEWVSSSWLGFMSPKELAEEITPVHPSGVTQEVLRTVGQAITSFPRDFNIHPNLGKILEAKRKTIEEGQGIDMPTAEALAFGSLLLENKHVRVSGQDVERGTFSQRHAVLHDQKTERQYVPLNNISANQAEFTICNSSLSEFGTLGFELGYSLADPNALVVWEAQFGDFANNAQCIIDQFIASGEKKWLQRTGLVLSLPHGYDGQGPEHSSGRIERFLQLCDDHPYKYPTELALQRQHQDANMQVVYPSTPANLFHALRRQIHRDFRKPVLFRHYHILITVFS